MPALASILVEQSNAAVHWMNDVGIRWELVKEHAKVGNKRYFERGIAIHVAGGGGGQLDQWRRIAAEKAIEIRFIVGGQRGPRQHASGRGRARLHARARNMIFTPRAVIACAGGFQANAEMRARYLDGMPISSK